MHIGGKEEFFCKEFPFTKTWTGLYKAESREDCFFKQQTGNWQESIKCYQGLLSVDIALEDIAEDNSQTGISHCYLANYNSAIVYLLTA